PTTEPRALRQHPRPARPGRRPGTRAELAQADSAGPPDDPDPALTGRLAQVEDQDFRRLESDEPKRGLRADRRAIALPQRLTVERDGAARDLHPGVPLFVELVDHFMVALEQARVEADVLMDGHDRAAAPRPGDQPQHASLVRVGDRLLLVARLMPAAVRHEPDLEEVDRLARRRIELAVRHARAGAHPLDLAG